MNENEPTGVLLTPEQYQNVMETLRFYANQENWSEVEFSNGLRFAAIDKSDEYDFKYDIIGYARGGLKAIAALESLGVKL